MIQWFKTKAAEDGADPTSLAMSFVGISDHLTLRSDQLGLFVDIFDGKNFFT